MVVFYGFCGILYDIFFEGMIFFIEDVGECFYVIECMMYNLKLGGVFEKLFGFIIG